jgi:hypothetical protein
MVNWILERGAFMAFPLALAIVVALAVGWRIRRGRHDLP